MAMKLMRGIVPASLHFFKQGTSDWCLIWCKRFCKECIQTFFDILTFCTFSQLENVLGGCMLLRPLWSVFRQMLKLRNLWKLGHTVLLLNTLIQLCPLHVGEQVHNSRPTFSFFRSI